MAHGVTEQYPDGAACMQQMFGMEQMTLDSGQLHGCQGEMKMRRKHDTKGV